MFQKVLEYAGEYRKTTYLSMAVMLIGIVMNVLPFLFIYQLIRPLLLGESLELGYAAWRVAAIAVCGVLYAVLYVKGLSLSHRAAYNTLKNLRASLQGKLERQPLGVIQEKGVGALKKMFIDDIDSIELLLAHALPEGLANLAVPAFVFLAMFFVDWKLALLSLCALPLGLVAMMAMYRAGTSKMGAYYASAQKMNNTIVEYINGMEVVKVFNRDGESYQRFEQDVRGYRDFTLAWYKVCWPWMALYNSILPCVALFTLPIGAYLVLVGYSTLPDFALVLCMSFGVGAPLLRALGFMSTLPQINYKITALEQLMGAGCPLCLSGGRGAPRRLPHRAGGEPHRPGGGVGQRQVHPGQAPGPLLRCDRREHPRGRPGHPGDERGGPQRPDLLCGPGAVPVQHEPAGEHPPGPRLGRPEATDQEVLAAAEKAQCGEFLARLEHGIHTMAGDGGKMLSGGERQRISLARAILKNAPIVVLDEATAFMDPENEEKMNEAIAEVIRGKTVLVIAHRLHSIVNADQICVLEQGTVADVGTHEELLGRCPAYQKLWQAAEDSAQWGVNQRGGAAQ